MSEFLLSISEDDEFEIDEVKCQDDSDPIHLRVDIIGDEDTPDITAVPSRDLGPNRRNAGERRNSGIRLSLLQDQGKKVSYNSSPLTSSGPGEKAPPLSSAPRSKIVPIVKLVNTNRADVNGKFAYVHAYYRPRERYAVTILPTESIRCHPANVYWGVDGPQDISRMKSGPRQSQLQFRESCSSEGTLFMSPTNTFQPNVLDKIGLSLQFIILKIKGKGGLEWAASVQNFIDIVQTEVLSSKTLEKVALSILPLICIPIMRWCVVFLYTQWHALFFDQSSIPSWITNIHHESIMSTITSTLMNLKRDFGMLTLILAGTTQIASFFIAEYRYVNKKANAMKELHDKRTFTTTEMIEYRMDYYFSTSKWAKVVMLFGFVFILIVIGAGALVLFSDDHSLSNAVWIAWTYVADPGTHADCPDYLPTRLTSFVITVGGMLIFALMIGIISDYIAEKVDDLKKGKSKIIDVDHTVMLNWNDKSLAIIQQLSLANESEGGGTIVVLANDDKETLEGRLACAVSDNENPLRLLGTEVIFRSGNPLLESELRRVSTQTAQSVVSLSLEEMDPDEADATQVRQVMALKAFEDFAGSRCHVVVEVQDVDNEDLFPLVAPDFAEVVVTHDIIGRLMLQCARCPGLATVLEAMMGFEGSEFYFEEWPELEGETFLDITCRFDDAVPLGIHSAVDGAVYINPENDHRLKDGDMILVLAEDNDSYEVNDGNYRSKNRGTVPRIKAEQKKVERILFCGWRRDLADMITQLDEYVENGSELWLLNLVAAKERIILLQDKGNKEELELKNLEIRNAVGNHCIRRDLNTIRAVDGEGRQTGETMTLDGFDSILILADAVAIENGANMMSCDSRSLSSLLIIQDIQKKMYQSKKETDPDLAYPCDPISEILDSRTKSLLSVANCKGYVMSNQIISSVMAQVSEDKDINTVLKEILTAEGSETYIRSVSRYVDLRKESNMSFWDVALRARQLREVAIGYKPQDIDFKEAAHLIINPPDKSRKRKWLPGDMVITIAMD